MATHIKTLSVVTVHEFDPHHLSTLEFHPLGRRKRLVIRMNSVPVFA